MHLCMNFFPQCHFLFFLALYSHCFLLRENEQGSLALVNGLCTFHTFSFLSLGLILSTVNVEELCVFPRVEQMLTQDK